MSKPDPAAAGLIRQVGGRSTGSIHGNATSADLKSEVYQSLLKSKEQQLLWALDRLNEVDRILGLLKDANHLFELQRVRSQAMAYLEHRKEQL